MAHMWVRSGQSVSNGNDLIGWAIFPLDEPAFALLPGMGRPVMRAAAVGPPRAAALLLRSQSDDTITWLIMNAGDSLVRINGSRLSTGIVALHDRDHVAVQHVGDFWFSTERLACIEQFPGASGDGNCPRCMQPLMGSAAVACPRCGVWHHERPNLPCWTDGPVCAAHCGQLTAFNTGFLWSPEDV